MNQMCKDVLGLIFDRLDFRSMVNANKVCHRWNLYVGPTLEKMKQQSSFLVQFYCNWCDQHTHTQCAEWNRWKTHNVRCFKCLRINDASKTASVLRIIHRV